MVTGAVRREADGCRWFDNGVLADPYPAAFASALCELAEDPGRIAGMGRCAAAFANATYSLPTMLQSLDALYSALLDRRSEKAPLVHAGHL
jgi:glycosyltransferase involved in cell wall biosynthesis